METITLSLPAMYGDHHVVCVRQIVAGLPGVTEVRASAARQQAEVTFDPGQLGAEAIGEALTRGGYPPGEPAGPPVTELQADDLRHVAAADRAEASPESRYAPPPAFGACPSLEMRAVDGQHPADRT